MFYIFILACGIKQTGDSDFSYKFVADSGRRIFFSGKNSKNNRFFG